MNNSDYLSKKSQIVQRNKTKRCITLFGERFEWYNKSNFSGFRDGFLVEDKCYGYYLRGRNVD